MLAVYAAAIDPDQPLNGLRIDERPEPEAPDGWATVAVRAASLNHHDVWSLRGVGLDAARLPMILGSTLMGRVMQGLVSDLAADPELAQAFRGRVVAARVAEVRRLVERGIERGELRPDADLELAHELLFGPIYYRLLLSGEPLEPGLAERVVDAVLPAYAR